MFSPRARCPAPRRLPKVMRDWRRPWRRPPGPDHFHKFCSKLSVGAALRGRPYSDTIAGGHAEPPLQKTVDNPRCVTSYAETSAPKPANVEMPRAAAALTGPKPRLRVP